MAEEQKKKRGFFRRVFRGEEPSTGQSQETSEASAPEAAEVPQEEYLDAPATADSDRQPEGDTASEEKQSMFRLRKGLTKTRSGFIRKLDSVLLGKKELDQQVLEGLEEVLVKADIGVKTAYQLLGSVTDRVKRRELSDPGKLIEHLQDQAKDLLSTVEEPLRVGYGTEPFVVLVVGVNGSGKTTTIAKIAARHHAAGRKVLLAAGDTFRAAAVEQLEIWGERIGCPVVTGKEKADPSSVAFDAVQRALKDEVDLLLVDTAGRLHTRVPLMEQIKKVKRTLAKKLPGAPHETLLVIDASMGQNAILQANTFHEALSVTGLALTKLDGTSKGGVLVGISNELKLPVRYIGIGEKMDDLRDFDAAQFAEALFADEE